MKTFILNIAEKYKKWRRANPLFNAFMLGFVLGVILSIIF